MLKLKRLVRIIDNTIEFVGRAFSILVLPLMAITTAEVVLRYVFNRPTIWAWDINTQIFGALVVIGGSYALRHDAHVRVDILVSYLSPRARARLNLITSILFFFAVGVLLWQTTKVAWESVMIRETMPTVWAPPVYHLMILIPVGAFLLILQGIANFIRDLLAVINEETGGDK